MATDRLATGRRPLVAVLTALLLFALAGCRTTAPVPSDPFPPPPPLSVPVPDAEPEALPPPPPKTRRYRPVPQGVFESRSTFPETEVTEWQMAGGTRLVFRPSRRSPRSVTLYAFAAGGFAAVPEGLADAALAVASQGGVGEGAAAVQPDLREGEAVLLGTASTDALDLLFEEVRRTIAAPGAAAPASFSLREGLDAALAGLPLGVRTDDSGAIRVLHERLFGDLRRFTFVLVGDATPEAVEAAAAEVLPRVRPPLQALLGGDEAPTAPPRVPTRPERHVLPLAERPAAAAAFRAPLEPTYDALAELDVLAALLEHALDRDGVHASAEVFFGAGVGEVRVMAEGERVEVGDFEEDLLEAVRALRAEPPSARALAQARTRRQEAHAAALAGGSGWLPWLARLYRYDHDTREALRYERRLGGVTAGEVHARARIVLDPTRYVLVVQPER